MKRKAGLFSRLFLGSLKSPPARLGGGRWLLSSLSREYFSTG